VELVTYEDPEPNGLASMLGGLIEANLEQHPERRTLLKPASIGIVAPDAEVAVTIQLSPGRVVVSNGVGRPPPDLLVRAPSDALIALSTVPLRFGLPDPMTKEGREVQRKMQKKEIVVKGMVRNLGKLARFTRLLSVR
jgi:hypothetical protein